MATRLVIRQIRTLPWTYWALALMVGVMLASPSVKSTQDGRLVIAALVVALGARRWRTPWGLLVVLTGPMALISLIATTQDPARYLPAAVSAALALALLIWPLDRWLAARPSPGVTTPRAVPVGRDSGTISDS